MLKKTLAITTVTFGLAAFASSAQAHEADEIIDETPIEEPAPVVVTAPPAPRVIVTDGYPYRRVYRQPVRVVYRPGYRAGVYRSGYGRVHGPVRVVHSPRPVYVRPHAPRPVYAPAPTVVRPSRPMHHGHGSVRVRARW